MSINLAGLELEHPLMNGGGSVKYHPEVKDMLESAAAAIVIGSITMEKRDGNPGETFYTNNPDFSINSIGLKNPGREYYETLGPEMVRMAHDAGKKIIFNIAGLTPEDFGPLAELAMKCGVDAIEVNLGCPNTHDPAQLRPTFSLRTELVHMALWNIEIHAKPTIPTFVKVSPVSDMGLLAEIAKILNGSGVEGRLYRWISGVTTTNTFPDAFFYKPSGRPAIDPMNGFGGYGGKAMLPIALGQIGRLRSLLQPEKRIIGVGGIETGTDVFMMLRRGASAVQSTTTFLKEGCNFFSRVLQEMVELEEMKDPLCEGISVL